MTRASSFSRRSRRQASMRSGESTSTASTRLSSSRLVRLPLPGRMRARGYSRASQWAAPVASANSRRLNRVQRRLCLSKCCGSPCEVMQEVRWRIPSHREETRGGFHFCRIFPPFRHFGADGRTLAKIPGVLRSRVLRQHVELCWRDFLGDAAYGRAAAHPRAPVHL